MKKVWVQIPAKGSRKIPMTVLIHQTGIRSSGNEKLDCRGRAGEAETSSREDRVFRGFAIRFFLSAAHVGTLGRVDFDQLAFFNEERHVDNFSSFKRGWFLNIISTVATDAFS